MSSPQLTSPEFDEGGTGSTTSLICSRPVQKRETKKPGEEKMEARKWPSLHIPSTCPVLPEILNTLFSLARGGGCPEARERERESRCYAIQMTQKGWLRFSVPVLGKLEFCF